MRGHRFGLTQICQGIMPDGNICGKILDNCNEHQGKGAEHACKHDPAEFTDPIDALVYLTQAVGGDKVKHYLEQDQS